MEVVRSNYSFEGIQLKTIEFSALSNEQAKLFNENPGRISLSSSVDEEKKDDGIVYKVTLIVELFDDEDLRFLMLEMEGLFLACSDMTPEFAERITSLQAPAIMFPYIRQFVSTITLNSNVTPLTLPLINLGAALQQAKKG